jgi:hypothetical protein
MSKEHWRALMGKTYLVAEILNGKEATMTIGTAKKEPVIKIQETKKQRKEVFEDKLVLRFKGTDFKLVLNVTNAETIANVLGSGYPVDWIGQQITLYPIQGKFFGEEKEAIRIKQDFSNVKM